MQALMWCCVMSYYRLILFSTASEAQLLPPIPPGGNKVCWPIPTVYQAGWSSYMGLLRNLRYFCIRIEETRSDGQRQNWREDGPRNNTIPTTPKRFDFMTEFPRLLSKTSITTLPWILCNTIWCQCNFLFNIIWSSTAPKKQWKCLEGKYPQITETDGLLYHHQLEDPPLRQEGRLGSNQYFSR